MTHRQLSFNNGVFICCYFCRYCTTGYAPEWPKRRNSLWLDENFRAESRKNPTLVEDSVKFSTQVVWKPKTPHYCPYSRHAAVLFVAALFTQQALPPTRCLGIPVNDVTGINYSRAIGDERSRPPISWLRHWCCFPRHQFKVGVVDQGTSTLLLVMLLVQSCPLVAITITVAPF